MCTTCMQCPQTLEENIGSPGTGVRAGCEWPRENPGPQEEQPVSTLNCQTIFPGPKDFFLKTGFCVAQAGFALLVLQSLPPEW